MKYDYTGCLIDPPEGWKYGFPKTYEDQYSDLKAFCIANGYPSPLVDSYGDYFHIRIIGAPQVRYDREDMRKAFKAGKIYMRAVVNEAAGGPLNEKPDFEDWINTL